jgi:hypothetical protein
MGIFLFTTSRNVLGLCSLLSNLDLRIFSYRESPQFEADHSVSSTREEIYVHILYMPS